MSLAQPVWKTPRISRGVTQPDFRFRRRTRRRRHGADVIATLTSGRRIVAHVSCGLPKATRNPAEHKLLRGVLGRAIKQYEQELRQIARAA